MMRILFIVTIFLLFSGIQSLVQGQQTREVILGGYNHAPPVITHASGTVDVTFESDTLIVSGQFSDLVSTYFTAGVFYGEPGESGNRLFRLTPELDEEMRSGTFSAGENRFYLPQSIRQALREGKLYVNISSRRYQRGEIRGQIPSVQ